METLERWIDTQCALLDLGVPLRVPETAMSHCETERSTLQSLGFGRYVRCDHWFAYESGHGRYGGTERTELSHDALCATLRAYAERGRETVRPWTAMSQAQDTVDTVQTLARVREGAVALCRWYPTVESQQASTVVGDGVDLYWICATPSAWTRVERLDPEALALLQTLPIARDSVIASTEHHRAMAERARTHLTQQRALMAALQGDRARFVGPADASHGCTTGSLFVWVHFFSGSARLPHVIPASEHLASVIAAQALFANPQAKSRLIDATTRALVDEAERAVRALGDALLDTRLAYQRNTSIATWCVWIEGRGIEVTVADARPVSAVSWGEPALPWHELAAHVSEASHADRFHPIDAAWKSAALALLSTQPKPMQT
ncbi:MAG: hypothetical protein Q8Q09_09720 [Deltaproteobacteria bacterium]|nr:hypothetical protein [Deltaproteobacteria bacterium]